jgi:hypothetical protein
MSDTIIGTLVALLGPLGIVMASHALDDGIYIFGLGLFLFAVAFVSWLVKRSFDRSEA